MRTADLAPRAAALGVDLDELRNFVGEVDLGFNATGCINSKVHFTGDEIIIEDTMPAHYVQDILDSVEAFGNQVRNRKSGGEIVGQIPLPIYHMWQKEWANTKKQDGMLFGAFLMQKLCDRDYSKLKVNRS